MREIVNALLYQSRTGCQWDYLPRDPPPAGVVKYYFYTWRNDGTGRPRPVAPTAAGTRC